MKDMTITTKSTTRIVKLSDSEVREILLDILHLPKDTTIFMSAESVTLEYSVVEEWEEMPDEA